jgi:hypothetical protein
MTTPPEDSRKKAEEIIREHNDREGLLPLIPKIATALEAERKASRIEALCDEDPFIEEEIEDAEQKGYRRGFKEAVEKCQKHEDEGYRRGLEEAARIVNCTHPKEHVSCCEFRGLANKIRAKIGEVK